jgi:phenylacetate-CoA ligase
MIAAAIDLLLQTLTMRLSRPHAVRRALPFTTSEDIRDWRRFLCIPEEQLAAAFTSSGATGEPKQVYFGWREYRRMITFSALALRMFYTGPLKVLIALPLQHGLWIGSATARAMVRRAGGLPLPVGTGDPAETVTWMERFRPNMVISSPSHMSHLTRQAEQRGYRPALERIVLGGEMLRQETRDYLHDYWDADVANSYGMTEIGGAQTISVPECEGLYLNAFYLITEIIDPQTAEPADEGELVFTTIAREAMPLLRYRSGDRARWVACTAPFPTRAVAVLGRLDDMFMVSGMHLYGHLIAEALADVRGATGRVSLRIRQVNRIDQLGLVVEGQDVDRDQVRQQLYSLYPKVRTAVRDGRLELELEVVQELSQIKALAIIDERS